MDEQNCGQKKDKRLLVLLALGTGILVTGWLAPAPIQISCDYYYQLPRNGRNVPVVVRMAKESYSSSGPDGVKISAKTPCAETPPKLALFFDLPLPINRAYFHDMILLPGIGSKRAEDIVLLREQQGTISGPEELMQVDGIGEKLAEQLLHMICFD